MNKTSKVVGTLGSSFIGIVVSAIMGAIIVMVIALLLFGPGTMDWYNHNAALNNGEWAMYAGIMAGGAILIIIAVAGVIGALVSGFVGGLITFVTSMVFFAGEK